MAGAILTFFLFFRGDFLPQCYCLDCGKPLKLTEDPISKLFSDLTVFMAKCENGHRYELIEDLRDGGRTILTQVLDSDVNGCEDDGEDYVGGPEMDLAREWN